MSEIEQDARPVRQKRQLPQAALISPTTRWLIKCDGPSSTTPTNS